MLAELSRATEAIERAISESVADALAWHRANGARPRAVAPGRVAIGAR
ncbi:MAG: hypothetical protein AMXMBFR34_04170 [Myxococcaceae bacterium]